VRRAVVSGYFTHAAKKDPKEGYMTMVEGNPVFIHPSSALFNKNPEWVLYHELVLTTKEYMRNVMTIEPKVRRTAIELKVQSKVHNMIMEPKVRRTTIELILRNMTIEPNQRHYQRYDT
jgi:HrpA-like RNA helicase